MKILNRLKWSGFRGKLFFMMAGGTAGTIIVLTTIGLLYAWLAVGRSVHRDLQVIASRTAGEIDQYLTGKTDSLVAVREVLSYPNEDRFRLQLMLKRISLEFNQFSNLAIYDTSNNLIASSSADNPLPLPKEILNIVKEGKEYRSPMLLTKGNLPYIRVALPLFWQGEVFRILLADIDILHVWNKVDGIRIGDTGRASILSKEGVFLADNDKSRVLKMQRWQDTISSMTPLIGKEGLIDANDRRGRSLDIAYAEMPSTGWTLLISQEHRESLHFLVIMFYWAAATMIAAFFGAYYLSSYLSMRLSKPLEQIYKGVGEIARGNFKYEIAPLEGRELSSLGKHLNSMAKTLEQKENAEKKLAISERLAAAGRLAADVAHEINNPLAIMKNYIYIISKKKLKKDDPNQQFLAIIDGEIDRSARIIQQFNDFYKGSRDINLEEVDLLQPLREVIDFCKVDAEEKGITIEEELAEGGKVMADKDKLKQVFLNLIKNAEEAIPNNGRITVKTCKADGKINISISDTGSGIKKEHLKKVFDPFFSTKGIKGTGLGLSVTYGIVKNFSGDIEVTSEEGEGTTFKVVLPVV